MSGLGPLRRTLYLFIATVVVAPVLTASYTAAVATEQSDWFKAEPEIHDAFDMGTTLPPYSTNGNRNCTKQKVVTRPEKLLPVYQSEQSHESCVVNSTFGAVSESGYLQATGTTTFGRLTYPNGSTLTVLPIPSSPNIVYFGGFTVNGPYLFLIQDFLGNISGTTDVFGQVTYSLKSTFTSTPLKDKSGSLVGVQTDSVSFSASGQWMVADIPYVGHARINTRNFTMQIFDTPYSYI